MSKNHYQIPKNIPKIFEKTLIICLAHRFAKVFSCHLKGIEELKTISTDDAKCDYSDKEGFSYISRGAGGSGIASKAGFPCNFENDERHYQNIFLKYFVKELSKLFNRGKYQRIIIFLPEDIKNVAKDKLPTELFQKTEFIKGNFTKHNALDLVKKIYSEKQCLFPL